MKNLLAANKNIPVTVLAITIILLSPKAAWPAPDDLFTRASQKAAVHDYDGAIRDLTELIRQRPAMVEAFQNRALVSCL
jgi:hypothetical protein